MMQNFFASSLLGSRGRRVAPSANNAQADWLARATAPGVTFAYNFDSQAYYSGAWNAFSFGAHKFVNGMGAPGLAKVTQTTDGPSGSALRIDVIGGDNNTSPALILPLDGSWTSYTQGMGNTPFYVCYRFKIPASRLVHSTGALLAFKQANIAFFDPADITGHSSSNAYCEHVMEDTYQRGFPAAYHRDTAASFPPFEEAFGGSDFKIQNAVDNGSGLADADRFCLYSTSGSNYPGCHHWITDRYMTVKMRIKVGTYGGVGSGATRNEFDLWVADQGAVAWDHLISSIGHDIGPSVSASNGDTYSGGLNGIHLHAYESQSVPTVDAYHQYAELIVSTNDVALPTN